MSLRIAKRNRSNRIASTPISIGVCGLGHNTGTTYLSISLTNFLCSKKKKDAAYIELNATHQIRYLNQSQNQSRTANMRAFPLMDLQIYPEQTLLDLPGLFAQDHDYLVFDFGIPNTSAYREFLRCNIRLIICELSPWKWQLTRKQLDFYKQQYQSREHHITYLVHSGGCTDYKSKLQPYITPGSGPDSILLIPYLSDPFHITSGTFDFFETILTGDFNTT